MTIENVSGGLSNWNHSQMKTLSRNCFPNQNQFTFYLFFYLSLLCAIKSGFNPIQCFYHRKFGVQNEAGFYINQMLWVLK